MNEPLVIGPNEIHAVVAPMNWGQNCYLVSNADTKESLVVDPGLESKQLSEWLGQRSIERILLTHAHYDHVGGAASVSEVSGVDCDLHSGDRRLLRHAPMYALSFSGRPIDPVERTRSFDTPFSFSFGGVTVRALHTPGHTPGSICYDFGDFVFTGDTLLFEAVGRTDLPGGDRRMLHSSIDALFEGLVNDSAPILPGHGRMWSVGEARSWWLQFRGAP